MHKHRLTLPQTLSLGFFSIIFIGTLLLLLPFATTQGNHTTFMNALFTATSATCITGLTVVPTATHWTVFGQMVIMYLMEIGALGFMSFTAMLYTLANRRMDLSTRLLVKDSLNLANLSDTHTVTKYVIRLSIVIQAIGAILLAPDLIDRFGVTRGLYYSVFHSISSFGNAGFVIFPENFSVFANDPYMLSITSILIIAGGLGFLVWRDILLYPKLHRYSLHSKIAMGTSFILILMAFVIFMITEHNLDFYQHTLSFSNRVIDTLFMAVSPRTAGFEIMPYSAVSLAGIAFTMFLMYVGGTPGSTAGGIKTTTLGILWLQTWAALRGKEDVTFGNRRFSQSNINRALMLVFVSALFLGAVTLVLSMTEQTPREFGIEYIGFEVFAAFSTTGLSLGLTPSLTVFGKILIMLVMFVGRVGVFTVMFSVLNVHAKPATYRYPEENILIG
ncbi:Trk family potassium uptake protein [Periweissella cryptocerci]|uniref:Trk family potassium uptake protein n=1 Tax=Periweissella cryptocerci TaxID=2506420 RepID=A0A4P6YUD7_9LACO|nr:potassium transporter TrkG [Periweissella cryptocerci]QBO36297.1 Trk family potassium uptake protein [Periweissella cryptocerci]